MRGISDDDARWKPAPDRFSIAEVLAHLSHSEGHCYRMRVDRFLEELWLSEIRTIRTPILSETQQAMPPTWPNS
jgi:hypothetical protein